VDIMQEKVLVKRKDQSGAAGEALLGVDICFRAGAFVAVMGPGGQ
jgi:ABC-type lipoprotein export system ATPase subunit